MFIQLDFILWCNCHDYTTGSERISFFQEFNRINRRNSFAITSFFSEICPITARLDRSSIHSSLMQLFILSGLSGSSHVIRCIRKVNTASAGSRGRWQCCIFNSCKWTFPYSDCGYQSSIASSVSGRSCLQNSLIHQPSEDNIWFPEYLENCIFKRNVQSQINGLSKENGFLCFMPNLARRILYSENISSHKIVPESVLIPNRFYETRLL